MLEKILSSARTVAIWGLMNVVLVVVLAGFVVAGFGIHDDLFDVGVYGASAILVLLVSGLVVIARRRRPTFRGWREPLRPATPVLFAVGVALLWGGLAFGLWVSIGAVLPFAVVAILEISARRVKF